MSGTIQVAELCRKYNIGTARFYNWKEQLTNSAKEIFEDRGRKPDMDAKNLKKERENARLKDVIAEITSENLEQRKQWKIRSGKGEDMRSMFYDIHSMVKRALRWGLTIKSVLHTLGIPRSWYYSQLSVPPLLDQRFNPLLIRDDEWIVVGFKHRNPRMSFREIAYTLIDEDLAYLSPSTVYRILKKHYLITPWKHPTWQSTRPEHAKHPDERW